MSVAVTDKRLWGKPLQVIDQIEIVRGNNIVGVVTNVAPVLTISHFNNDDSRPQDKLTVPTRPLQCGEGTRSFGPPLTPGLIPIGEGENGSMVQSVPSCQLVVFCDIHGVGKTALSRRVADALGATFLRIDTIEAAIAATRTVLIDNPLGYVVARRVAADQLSAGRPVVADPVNSCCRCAAWLGLSCAGLRGAAALCPGRVQRQD